MARIYQKIAAWFRAKWEQIREFLYDHTVGIGITFFIFAFLVILLWKNIFIVIPAGHAGVLFKRLGGGTEVRRVYGEGMHIISPWNIMNLYDTRLQNLETNFSIISSNGLSVGVDVAVRYRPKIELLGMLHKELGTNYANKVIVPEVQALIRNLFGQYSPEELYTSKRAVVQQILQGSLDEMSERYILVDDVLLQKLTLPSSIQTAIESKLTEEQRVEEMKFRLEREEREAERKVVEAKGVDNANQILAASLSDIILRYKAIEASLELAKSTNTKVILFGGGDGLPLIYDAATGGNNPTSTAHPPAARTAPSSNARPATK